MTFLDAKKLYCLNNGYEYIKSPSSGDIKETEPEPFVTYKQEEDGSDTEEESEEESSVLKKRKASDIFDPQLKFYQNVKQKIMKGENIRCALALMKGTYQEQI